MKWDLLIAYITAAGLILGLVFNGFEMKLSRKNNYNQVVSNNRINWISDFRELIFSFLVEYNDKRDKKKLNNILFKIKLYCSIKNQDQLDLINILTEAIAKDKNDNDISSDTIIDQSNIVLQNSWNALKLESGMTKKKYNKIRNYIYKDYKKHE